MALFHHTSLDENPLKQASEPQTLNFKLHDDGTLKASGKSGYETITVGGTLIDGTIRFIYRSCYLNGYQTSTTIRKYLGTRLSPDLGNAFLFAGSYGSAAVGGSERPRDGIFVLAGVDKGAIVPTSKKHQGTCASLPKLPYDLVEGFWTGKRGDDACDEDPTFVYFLGLDPSDPQPQAIPATNPQSQSQADLAADPQSQAKSRPCPQPQVKPTAVSQSKAKSLRLTGTGNDSGYGPFSFTGTVAKPGQRSDLVLTVTYSDSEDERWTWSISLNHKKDSGKGQYKNAESTDCNSEGDITDVLRLSQTSKAVANVVLPFSKGYLGPCSVTEEEFDAIQTVVGTNVFSATDVYLLAWNFTS